MANRWCKCNTRKGKVMSDSHRKDQWKQQTSSVLGQHFVWPNIHNGCRRCRRLCSAFHFTMFSMPPCSQTPNSIVKVKYKIISCHWWNSLNVFYCNKRACERWGTWLSDSRDGCYNRLVDKHYHVPTLTVVTHHSGLTGCDMQTISWRA